MDSSLNMNREPLLDDILLIKNEFINNKNSENNYLNENQKQIIQSLIVMGFNIEMIDMCFCFFTINNVEQAVYLMSKENEIWQHDYIESENKICIVCKEHSDHKNFITNRKKKLEKLKELNDSFNSIFKSSIEYLRESNSNRKNENSRYSEIDNSNDTIKIKSPNLFEININITDDDKETINNLHILNKVNSKGNFKNKYLIVIILKI